MARNASALESRHSTSLGNLADFVFGYDYFISYRQEDGLNLPRMLTGRLADKGFRVFLDEREFVAGDDLDAATNRRARISSCLLLIARPGAMTRSTWVVQEVNASIRAGKRIIVIDVDNAFSDTIGETEEEQARARAIRDLLRNRLRVPVSGGADGCIFDGDPPDTLVGAIERSFSSTRQDTRRSRFFAGAAAGFALLAIGAIYQAWQASIERARAVHEAQVALSRQLAAQASNDTVRPDLRLLLALSALDIKDTIEARRSLWNAIWMNRIPFYYMRLGTQDDLNGLAFSPDDTKLRAITRNGTLLTWDTSTHKSVGKLPWPRITDIYAAAFDPAGQNAVVAALAARPRPKVVEVSLTGEPSKDLSLPPAVRSTRGLMFSADNRHIAGTSPPDGKLLLWDTNRLFDPQSIECPTASTGARFSFDSHWLLAACDDDIRMWDMVRKPYRGTVIHDTPVVDNHLGTNRPIPALSFDNRTVAAGNGKTIKLWDAVTQQPGSVLIGHSDLVSAIAMSPTGPHLASAGFDGLVVIWDYQESPYVLHPMIGHNTAVYDIEYSTKGGLAASVGDDGTVIQWDVSGALPLAKRLSGAWTDEKGMSCSANHVFAFFDHDNVLNLSNGISTMPEFVLKLKDTDASLSIAGDASAVGYISDDGIHVVDLSAGAKRNSELIFKAPDAKYLAGNADGSLWAYAEDKKIAVVRRSAREIVAQNNSAHEDIVNVLTFSPDGNLLASGADDSIIKLWEAPTMTERATFKIGGGFVRSLAFSPTEPLLASGDSNGDVVFWNLSTRKQQGVPLRGHGRPVFALAFSPDGTMLASGGGDQSVILWDVASHQPLSAPLKVHGSILAGLSFTSNDGRQLVSWDDDGEVFWWDLDMDHWKKSACTMANRSISREEWAQYVGNTSQYRPLCAQ